MSEGVLNEISEGIRGEILEGVTDGFIKKIFAVSKDVLLEIR